VYEKSRWTPYKVYELHLEYRETPGSLSGVFLESFRSLSGIYRDHIYSTILSYKTLQKDQTDYIL